MWPDIGAFTPVTIEVGGVLVWSGRVAETPVSQSSRVVNVQCEGWQYHLDDDVYARAYVHTRTADYKDQRALRGAVLAQTALNAAGQVTTDGGGVYLGWPTGTPLVAGARVGAVLDLGAGCTGKRVVTTWESSNNNVGIGATVIAANTPDNTYTAGTYDQAFFFLLNTGATGATSGTLATARRYIHVFMYLSGGAGTLGTDVFVKFTSIHVYADTTYESGGVSVLKATTIIPDALTRGTLLLSSDRSQVDPGGTVTFAFPEFALEGEKTPREVISAANAAHDYVCKIDERKRLVFKPKPSTALVEIGDWPGSSFEDASANSGEEIFNRVIVEGTAANGEKLAVARAASQAAGVVAEPITSPAPTNPSFATNTTSWSTLGGSSITRDTVRFDTSPASGRWDRGAGVALLYGDVLGETFTGTFLVGVPYTLTMRVYGVGAYNSPFMLQAYFGRDLEADWALASLSATNSSGSWQTLSLTWTPATTYTSGVTVTLFVTRANGNVAYVDSLSLSAATPTLVDRRGFRRTHVLPVKASLTAELGVQIGDVWLAAHKTTALKGTVRVEGDAAAREIVTGAGVPPEQLLLRTGELLRLSDRVDPDSGGQGRKGRIAEVTYSVAENAATVALDSRRTSHEALLERLSVVIGSG
jgi:hypothetical protein